MSNEITTTDLRKFGNREKAMMVDLLNAELKNGLPADFYEDEVTIMMNLISGNVFFTNSEYQVAMMNGKKLESFYSCPICGHEGFLEEMEHGEDNKECQEYIADIKKASR